MILAKVLIERKVNVLNRPFYYLYPFNKFKKQLVIGVRVIVSFNKKDVIGYVIGVDEKKINKKEFEKKIGFVLNEIKSVQDEYPILNDELLTLANKIADYYLAPFISVLQTMLPPSLKPRLSSLKSPKIHYDKYLEAIDNNSKKQKLTLKQQELLNLIIKKKCILKKDVVNKNSIVKKLIEIGYLKETLVEKTRFNILDYVSKEEKKEKKLTVEQTNAVNNILNSEKKISLLEGVTGSGKTEVYLNLSKNIIKKGLNVLILVPEISLTRKTASYYFNFFHDYQIAIFHSGLTASEKYDEYRRIASGKVRIVIGARSAIFVPLNNIGLIVLDEEHSESYKQDIVPQYDAHKIAFMRAEVHNSLVVLGSATPLFETRIRALKGLYNYVKLSKRFNNSLLPQTHIIDIGQSKNLLPNSSIFSNFLYKKIKDRLEKKEQVILLINRRGFATSIICRECNDVIKCPNCFIALVYHRKENILKCHHCNYIVRLKNCPNCGSKYLLKIGFGTEKIEFEINRLFPTAKISRLDSDVSNVSIDDVLEKFKNHNFDILIGTQMIAKGHDFPNVTLVGIVLADMGLSIPSFRNTERVFSLITQAIGRSGRDKKSGEAIIQTYIPKHYVINLSSKQNYNDFFNVEMQKRKISQYPPYTFIISLIAKSRNEEVVNDSICQIFNELNKTKYKDVKIIGPCVPYISFDKKHGFVRQIIIKYKKDCEIKKKIFDLLNILRNKTMLDISVNVDPFDI